MLFKHNEMVLARMHPTNEREKAANTNPDLNRAKSANQLVVSLMIAALAAGTVNEVVDSSGFQLPLQVPSF